MSGKTAASAVRSRSMASWTSSSMGSGAGWRRLRAIANLIFLIAGRLGGGRPGVVVLGVEGWPLVEAGEGVEGRRLDFAEDGGSAAGKWSYRFGFRERVGLLLKDASDGASVEATIVLGSAGSSTESFLAIGVTETDEGPDVDGREGLHAKLEAIDEGSKVGKAAEECLVEALAAVGATVARLAGRQGSVVGGVNDETALFRVWDVGAGKGDVAVWVEDFGVL